MAFSTPKVYLMIAGMTVSLLGLLFLLFPAQALYLTGEITRRTLAAIYLLTVVSLLISLGNDARKGLVRLCSRRTGPQAAIGPGPLTLESGTAESETDPIPAATTAAKSEFAFLRKLFPFTRQSVPGKLFSLVLFTYLLACHLRLSVSPERTAGENVSAVVMYLMNGLHGVFLIVVCMAAVKHRKAVAGEEVEAPIFPEAVVEVKEIEAPEVVVEPEAL